MTLAGDSPEPRARTSRLWNHYGLPLTPWLLWFLFMTVAILTLSHLHSGREQLLGATQLRLLEQIHRATEHRLTLAMDAFIDGLLRNEALLANLRSGLTAAPDSVNAWRQRLRQQLAPALGDLRRYGINQLQIIRQDGRPLLQLHSPQDADEPPTTARPLVHQVLKQHRSLFGIEADIQNLTLHYVHPLDWQYEPLGAIDLGITMEKFLVAMEQLESGASYRILLDQAALAFFPKRISDHFQPSDLSPALHAEQPQDNLWICPIPAPPPRAEVAIIDQQLLHNPDFQETLRQGQSFFWPARSDQGPFMLALLRLNTSDDQGLGYVIGYFPAPELTGIDQKWLVHLMTLGLLLGVCAYLGWLWVLHFLNVTRERTLLRAITESMHEGLCVTDQQDRIQITNPAAAALLQRHPEQLVGHSYHEFIQHVQGEHTDEVRLIRADGTAFRAAISHSQLYNADHNLAGMLCVFRDIEEECCQQEQLLHLAHFDALTGLPNRTLINQRLQEALAHARSIRQPVAFLLISLNNLQAINDSYGHDCGDALLPHVAHRLREFVAGDNLGRWGGSEFTLIINKLQHHEDAMHIAEWIIQQFEQPFALENGLEVFVISSIGVGLYPQDGMQPDDIIRAASAALHNARLQGPNSYRSFDPNQTALTRRNLELDVLMRNALNQGDFELYYQPLIGARDNSVVGAEVLVRWLHRDFGMVPPAHFIPVAEQSGFIIPLGDWILTAACQQFCRWRQAGLHLSKLAVNLSPRQFHQPGLVERIQEILHNTGMAAQHLELEVTEGAMIKDGQASTELLRRLKALGLQLAIDDFGTGYSSLSYLKRFPVDKLKIDQSFIHNLPEDQDDAVIVSTILAMGRNLNLEVLAEGVETASQVNYLRTLGCDTLQGYFFSQPVPAPQFADWIQFHQTEH